MEDDHVGHRRFRHAALAGSALGVPLSVVALSRAGLVPWWTLSVPWSSR